MARPALRPGAAARAAWLLLALAWLGGLVAAALLAPWLGLPDPAGAADFAELSVPPSPAHWLGTDDVGRDLLSRVIWGTRISLTVGLGATLIGLLAGGALGLTAGYLRGRYEQAVLWLLDVILSFPPLVAALTISAVLGPSLANVTLAIAFIKVPAFARVTRAATLLHAQREFVLAAHSLGASHGDVLLRELLPNVLLATLGYALTNVAVAIATEGALAFLGLSVPPPAASWGALIAQGRPVLAEAPHVALIPALVMFVTVLTLNLIGDAWHRRFDTRGAVL
ncbi:ABC transporter permease [Verminephrobacter eiseniae]|uniref:ABC transporter permease n=1 Tax=Verminephrobacter eiseniae TaxID=364317 RepID=UPI0022381A75|nr:ABC transporter permease [Verminephrobacter eiseniae]MCW5261914.1 ABC transporter permease [Verminephrobacter eiseniae]